MRQCNTSLKSLPTAYNTFNTQLDRSKNQARAVLAARLEAHREERHASEEVAVQLEHVPADNSPLGSLPRPPLGVPRRRVVTGGDGCCSET